MEIRVPAPLFDRLVDREPHVMAEGQPLRTLDPQGLRESVRRELERMLNTRSSLPVGALEERPELTVLEYGIPDLSAFSCGNAQDEVRLAALIARAVAAFEPRLRGVKVFVTGLQDERRSLRLRIDGLLAVDEVAEPISFPAVLGLRTGVVEIEPLGD